MPYWETIAADRYAAERLWLPSLSLDLISRVYSGFKVPFKYNGYGTHNSSTVGSWHDMTTITIVYPEQWSLDTTFDDMGLRLGFPIRVDCTSATSVQARFKSSPEDTVTSTGSWTRGVITRTYTALPTGATEEIIEWYITANVPPGGESADSDRGTSSPFGPDCYFEFYQT